MRGAVAAGNRHTAEAGAWALAQGGNAVDAVVAAALAAFVAEGPLTGPAGGGFFLVRDGRRRADAARLLLRRPVTAAGADGRGADRLRRRVDAGVPRRRRRRSPFPGSSRGWPRPTRATGGSRGQRCSSPRSSSRAPGSRCPARSGSCSRSSSRSSSAPRRAAGSTARTTRAETAAMVPGLERLRDHGASAVARADAGPRRRPRRVSRRSSGTPIEATFEGMRVVTCPPPSKGGAVVAGGLAAIAAREPRDARTPSPSRSSRRCSPATGERRASRR